MKTIHFLVPAAALVVLSTAAFLPVQSAGGPVVDSPVVDSPVVESVAVDGAEDSELKKLMKEINKGMRGLRSLVKDPERAAEACEAVDGLQAKCLMAKSMKPLRLADIAKDEQGKFLIDYRKTMHEMLGQLFQLEIALLEERTEDAQAIHKAIYKSKSPAHKKFQKPKD